MNALTGQGNDLRFGIIGVGNMGSKYGNLIQEKTIAGMEIGALTRVRGDYARIMEPSIKKGVPVYQSADQLLDAVEKGELQLDGVIVATPHYAHEKQVIRSLQLGLHVLCDKPAGVYLRQARNMNMAADHANRDINDHVVYGMVFNQRTWPVYQKIKEIVSSGCYGQIKRVNWVITDWYRPDAYYTGSSWHATWEKDGGGLLLNQCPHNLDLLQWICGMPAMVRGFCHEGRFHDIEVEDDLTVYMEWENGATGTFISSTGDAPGLNRLEISMDDALLTYSNGELTISELYPEIGMKEAEYRKTARECFRKLYGVTKTIPVSGNQRQYEVILQNFANACKGREVLLANGREGYKSLLLANAIYLSSWRKGVVFLPEPGSREEGSFMEQFEFELVKRGGSVRS